MYISNTCMYVHTLVCVFCLQYHLVECMYIVLNDLIYITGAPASGPQFPVGGPAVPRLPPHMPPHPGQMPPGMPPMPYGPDYR